MRKLQISHKTSISQIAVAVKQLKDVQIDRCLLRHGLACLGDESQAGLSHLSFDISHLNAP